MAGSVLTGCDVGTLGTLVERVMYSGSARVDGQMYLRMALSSRFEMELLQEWWREWPREGGSERRGPKCMPAFSETGVSMLKSAGLAERRYCET